ncbi:MAG: hypothetical protein ACRCS6_08535 [Turicibacter sp.]
MNKQSKDNHSAVNEFIHQMYDLTDGTPSQRNLEPTKEAWYKLGYEDGIEIGKEEMMVRVAQRLLESLDDALLAEKLEVDTEFIHHLRSGNFDVFKDYQNK